MSSNFERLRARLADLQDLAFEAVNTAGGIVDEAIATVEEYASKVEDKATPMYNVNFTDAGKRINDFLKGEQQQAEPADEAVAESGGSEEPSLKHTLTVVYNYLVSKGYYPNGHGVGTDDSRVGLYVAEDFHHHVRVQASKDRDTTF